MVRQLVVGVGEGGIPVTSTVALINLARIAGGAAVLELILIVLRPVLVVVNSCVSEEIYLPEEAAVSDFGPEQEIWCEVSLWKNFSEKI
ncbi:MAG: hypothetical protein ABF876_13850 [Acetobacter aceti]|uniref:Uncharacterized protein n=1 Tax=Acetobacter aceti TaxID=435 RepID=A0A1U9KF99_ACEAC|nr:hypothetical protein [Acetobacter aceti]AQS84456.1 hypothetical protein A0U92_06345 [Acetobacter aceti]